MQVGELYRERTQLWSHVDTSHEFDGRRIHHVSYDLNKCVRDVMGLWRLVGEVTRGEIRGPGVAPGDRCRDILGAAGPLSALRLKPP
jgi:hypothetical protein